MNHSVSNPPGEVLLIDKALGWTSFDVVKKVRNLTKYKKVGHAGTLDPLATGLLIVCAGKKTKEINDFQGLPKEYTGTIVLGKTTPSHDLETDIDNEYSTGHITEDQVLEAFRQFKGKIWQTPPAYSAVKVKGKRAYDMARKGELPEIKQKEVEVIELECNKIDMPEIDFVLKCSKGFYVRSLARDMGTYLGVGAYLKSLRRTKIGSLNVDDAFTIETLVEQYSGKSV